MLLPIEHKLYVRYLQNLLFKTTHLKLDSKWSLF